MAGVFKYTETEITQFARALEKRLARDSNGFVDATTIADLAAEVLQDFGEEIE